MLNSPKKSLGQHFLTSDKILTDIAEAGEINPGETILEIGPGRGALTEKLITAGGKVVAVEKDRDLIPFLTTKFASAVKTGQLNIVEGDILDFKPEKELPTGDYKIIANIPYYLTGQFFRRFLQTKRQPSLIVALVQKEVADRIIATAGRESLLSISVKVYGRAKRLKTVPAGAFHPPPKVDSAIIKITDINKNYFTDINEETFFAIIKQAFGQKRKQLKNNLSVPVKTLAKCGLVSTCRPEELTIKQWQCLAQKLTD
ncbi:MAG: 16S rRNA (adenine(1518)-N(6)/adenine(1519)-N(6))-dimethyltransferase RsmA [Candidatus Paceibacterota bacterium]